MLKVETWAMNHVTHDFTIDAAADYVKVFLVDTTTWAPKAAAKTLTVSK